MTTAIQSSATATPAAKTALASAATTANQLVGIDFNTNINRPDWDLVLPAYLWPNTFLAAAPVFTTTVATGYSLDITIRGAVFEGSAGEPPRFNLFDATAPGVPIDVGVLDNTRQQVTVTWKGEAPATGWERWIYRFYVTPEAGGDAVPFPLAFVALEPIETARLLARAAAAYPATGARSAQPAAEGDPQAAPTCSTNIVIVDGLPTYPKIFVGGLTLPSGVYVDPLLNVLDREQAFNLEFLAETGKFSPTKSTPCNEGSATEKPLALMFKGVTDARSNCGGADVPRGFINSTVGDSTRACLIQWKEPDGAAVGRASSFLFAETKTDPETGAPVLVSTALDPTVINDLLENPPG